MDRAYRNLWIYVIANAVSGFGNHFQWLAVTSITFAITGSPLATAAQMAVSGLPAILWARWAGPLVDRYDPRRLMIAVSLTQSVITLFYLLVESVPALLMLNFLISSAGVLIRPSRAAMLPQMVGREALLKANARLATIHGAIQLFSPALAGTILVWSGAKFAFLFNSASFLFPAAGMLLIRYVDPAERRTGAGGAPAVGWAETWAFLRGRRDLILLILSFSAYELGMWAVNAIFFPYAKEVLGSGADVVGWSISAYFGAYLVTGMVLERWGERLRNPRLLYAMYVVGALVWMGYSITRSIPVALILSAFDGLVFTFAFTLFETKVQEEAPEGMRGRVFAFSSAMDQGSTVTGELMGGAMATYGSILGAIRWSGLMTIGLLAAIGAGRRLLPAGPVVQAGQFAPALPRQEQPVSERS